jgi:phage baseplate assembly protein V
MIDAFSRFIQPLSRRVRNMVARAVIKACKEDKALQRMQLDLLAEETLDGVEHVGHYGFISRPLEGAEGVVLFLGGERSSGVVIASEDRRYRLKTLANGEVALYTDEGDYVHFKRSRELHVRANKFKFQGASEELMDLIVQLCQLVKDTNDKLSITTTNTQLGPQPLLHASTFSTYKTTANTIKTKVEGIKV